MPGSSSDAIAHSRPPWSIALTMISLRQHVELLLHLALDVLGSPSAPRMSARPALRTLFAIIFAASARSYRMPDSSPVASGMVALLLDDETLDRDDRRCGVFDHADHPLGRKPTTVRTAGRIGPRIDLEAISNIAVAQPTATGRAAGTRRWPQTGRRAEVRARAVRPTA